MQLHICFFDERDPELLWIGAATVHTGPRIRILFVRQQRINDDLHPRPIFEELEAHEPLVEVVLLYDELLNLLGPASQHRQRPDKPALCD